MGIGFYRHLVTIEDPRHPLPVAPRRQRGRLRQAVKSATFPTTGLVSYWKLDEASGTRVDSVGTNHLTPVNGPMGAGGKIGNGCDFELDSSQYLSHASNADLQPGNVDFTFTAWVKAESQQPQQDIIAKVQDGVAFEYALELVATTFRWQLNGGAGGQVDSPGAVIGAWTFLVCWHDAAADTVSIQANNGTVVQVSTGGAVPNGANGEFRIGARALSTPVAFDGLIDEVGFWKRVLTAPERADLWNGGAGLTYPTGTAPTITTEPQSSDIASGDSVTLTVVADGTPPLTYQWAKDGDDIPGATSNTYDTGPLTETATYTVTVTNDFGSVTSADATVTVLPPIVYAPTWYCSLQSAATQVMDGQAAYFVRGRYHPAISLETQLLFEGRRFQVQSISDLDERHREVQLLCVEVVARGREPSAY